MTEEPKTESTELEPVDDAPAEDKPTGKSPVGDGPAKSPAERFAARKALVEKVAAAEKVEEPAPEPPAPASAESEASVEPEPVAAVVEDVVVDEPVVDEPAVDKPVVDKLVVDKPVVEEPVVAELPPVTEELPVPEPPVAKPAKPAKEPEPDEDEFKSFNSGSLAGELPTPRIKLLSILAAIVLVLDVLTKIVAVAFLEEGSPIRLFGGVLYLTFVRNPGAAFGLGEGMTWILALIALGVAGFILWISRNLRSLGWAIGLGMVLGGAVGNLADRLFRAPGPMQGHVVDFLSLFDPFGRVWPVFNIADSAIVCGGTMIVIMALMQRDYDGTVHKERKEKVAA